MRVVLLTGKGGVGKTTAAAATALLAARSGRKTLVLSTDPAHSLAEVIRTPPSADPEEVEPGLFVQQVDVQRRLEESWGAVQRYLTASLVGSGLDALVAEELTVLPGADELLALLEVRDQIRSGRWEVVVVDCAPTAETLRLLALPDALGWYLERLFPLQRRVARSLRPLLGRVLEPSGVGLPEPDVVTAALRLNDELADVRDCLECAHTTVRLVLTPETVVVAEARRTLATLALFGYPVDSVIVNRQFPTQHAEVGGSPWLRSWAVAQRAVLDDITSSFSPLPILHAGYAALEPVGPEALARLAEEVYADVDPLDDASESLSPHVERHGDHFLLSVPLPLADRSALDLARVGDDLVVTVAGFRRVWALPSGLRRCRVVSATLVSGRLEVRLQPDPEQWRPRG